LQALLHLVVVAVEVIMYVRVLMEGLAAVLVVTMAHNLMVELEPPIKVMRVETGFTLPEHQTMALAGEVVALVE
jgi:hypothetical protein